MGLRKREGDSLYRFLIQELFKEDSKGGFKLKEISITHIEPVFEDERGEIFDILDDENILHVGLITAKKGAMRGNHYHKRAKQYNYILDGKMELRIRDINESERNVNKYILEKGDFVYIPNGLVHTLIALEDSKFIDLNTESRSGEGYEEDTIRISHDTSI